MMLVCNPGGVLHKSMWYEGAIAWGPMPVLPQSVKNRMSANDQDQHAQGQPHAEV